MTSNWELQGLDGFQSCFMGSSGRWGTKSLYHAAPPVGGPWVGPCEQRHLNVLT